MSERDPHHPPDTEAPRRRRRGTAGVTIKDVAERAGVAPITVSRALNAPDTVSPPLRSRIDEAVRALGYRPNRLAGGLASARTRVVPLIVPSLSNVVFLEVIRGAQDVLEEAGYQSLLANTDYDLDREAFLLETLLGWAPSGLIVAGLRHRPRTLDMLRGCGRPVVEVMELAERRAHGDAVPPFIDMNVGLSHHAAGEAMGRHLVERGYRRIAYIGTDLTHDYRAGQRHDGLRQVLAGHGLRDDLVLTRPGAAALDFGGAALVEALERWPDLEAIFFANDDLAVGAILEAQRRGIAIPGRIAVAGFNGLPIGEHVMPRLTTIVSPRYQIGRLAAELLLTRFGGTTPPARCIDVGFELAVREST